MAKINREAAEEQFKQICEDIFIDPSTFETDDDEKDSKKKIISAIMGGRLEYDNFTFKLTLITPITTGSDENSKDINVLTINEPSVNDLREMASVKKKNDDIGKGMAVLGAVTGHGLPVINKMKSRDCLVAVAVMSLFL